MTTGIIGKKLGMTQVFDAQGRVVPVTVIEAGPCTIVQRKTRQNDGYDAVQLGFGAKKAHGVSKPMLGHIQKAGKGAFRTLRELRIDSDSSLEVGQEIRVDIFQAGEYVDVTGQTKGRGFAGVVKRWGFRGGRGSHGSMFHRAPGSIGGSSFPSRVFKNMKMGGHYGNERVTVLNLQVFSIQPEKNLLVKETLELPESVFGAEVKTHLLHQVVVAQRNARRSGSASTKTRKEVAGGGRKPYRQKGTGRSRMGTTSSPLLRGGGTVFGPRPRSYEQKVNRKAMKAALRCALSAMAREDRIVLVDDLDLPGPQTKEFLKVAEKLGLSRALLVTEEHKETLDLGIRNLKSFKSLPVSALNVYDILSHEQLVLTRPAFEKISEVLRK
jgi:large subunit ribosomal protein L3